MNPQKFALIAIGNILQKDDGVAIYAAKYLQENYQFTPELEIIHGGVEGMNLLNIFMEYEEILFLDCINTTEKAGTIYEIPTEKLNNSSLVQKSAHEMGIMECLGMLELMDENIPSSILVSIVPAEIKSEMGLSAVLMEHFNLYIQSVLKFLMQKGFTIELGEEIQSIEDVIQNFKI